VAAFALAVGSYVSFVLHSPPLIRFMSPVDIWVYRSAGLIVRGATPLYGTHKLTTLYHWARNPQFTYTPFAAMVFTILTVPAFQLLMRISVGVNILALLGTIWMCLGCLGYRRGMARLGGTLLLAAALFWTEPVQRTLYLGQIELVLMALIIWDQCQPPGSSWCR
jgi:alpha-1,2-mannosyltransferase